MYRSLRDLLLPFAGEYKRFLAGVVLRQGLAVLGGYSLVWALRHALTHSSMPEWAFVAVLVAFDAGWQAFDLRLNYFFSARISYPLFGSLRLRSLEQVLRMPMEWHQRQSSGELTGKVNNGIGKVVQTAEGLSRELIPAVIQTAFSLVPLLLFSPVTTPLLLVALCGFLWITVWENRQRRPFARRRFNLYARDFEHFSESVDAIQAVVQYGQESQVLRKYRRIQQRIVEAGLAEARIGKHYGFRRNLAVSLAKRACQGIWIWQYRKNALDGAMILYLNMLTEQLLASFFGYASLIERIYDGIEPARVLVKLMGEKPTIADSGNEPVEAPGCLGIRISNVRFAYPLRKTPVLSGLNLEIAPGTVLGIVGRSGAGKTTIQNLLTRMFDVQGGGIEIAGRDVRYWPLDQLRGLFAHVSQNGGAFFTGMTVAQAIRFTRPEAKLRDVIRAAKAACIHEDICRMPEKYRTRLGQGGTTLSKGQQQRMALAQALLSLDDERRILVLDEFTSALDSETEARILANLEEWFAGRTVIIIAHRISTVRRLADEIIVLDRTGICEHGTHDELLARGGWYAEMAQSQSSLTSVG
jgi:ABC-type multidrug transport system fused ATPase/permease subunit